MRRWLNKKISQDDEIGFVGKLPLHVEFIRHQVGQLELYLFEQWLADNYASLKKHNDQQLLNNFSAMPPQHFIWNNTNCLQPIIGCLFASHDRSGRQYPGLIMRKLNNPVVQEFPSIIPLAYHQVYDQYCAIANFEHKDNLLSFYDRLTAVAKVAHGLSRQHALELTLHAFEQLTYSELMNKLNIACENVLRLANSILDKQGVIYLPISNDQHNHTCVSFWLQLLENVLAKRHYQVYWHVGAQSQVMTLITNDIDDSHLVKLLDFSPTFPRLNMTNEPYIAKSCSILQAISVLIESND